MNKVSIKVRLIAFLLLGGLLPLAVMAGFVSRFVQIRLYDNLGAHLSMSAEELRDRIDRELFDRYRDLKTLAENPRLAGDPAGAVEHFISSVSRKQHYFGHEIYQCIQVRQKDRPPYRSGGCDLLETSFDVPSLPSAGLSGLSGVYMSRAGVPVIDVVMPVQGSAGWVSATMDLRSLEDILQREKIPGGLNKQVLIYDEDDTVIAGKYGGEIPRAGRPSDLPALLKSSRPASGFVRGPLIGDRQALAAVNSLVGLAPPLDTLKWKIAIVQPLDDNSEPTVVSIERLRQGIRAAVLITVLGAVFFSWILLRSILMPLQQLTGATLRMRQGDLSTQIVTPGSDELGQLAQCFNEMMKKLKDSLDELTNLAATDSLTGLANRRIFFERLDEEIRRAQRYHRPLTLAILDVDHFKRCNDTYGHDAGDLVLKEISRLCTGCCRDTDFVARYGGEEIVFIFPETDKENSVAIVERLRSSIEAFQIRHEAKGVQIKVTVSIGIAGFPGDAQNAKVLFSLADQALYKAKESGRNRIEVT